MADYKKILSHIAGSLVDKPEEVVVLVAEETDDTVTLELSVAP